MLIQIRFSESRGKYKCKSDFMFSATGTVPGAVKARFQN